MNKKFLIFSMVLALLAVNSCKRDEMIIGETDYPKDIAYIMLTKCAVKGCHDGSTAAGSGHTGDHAGNLDLTSWKKMFEGSSVGAVVIPYRADFSSLMYFVNTYDDLGPRSEPTMPYQKAPLTRAEVLKLKEWINAGAPDNKGNIMFSGDPNRKKYYVLNQGCRVVTVMDAQTNLPMRYIDVADAGEQTLSAHYMIQVGQYWYTSFVGGPYIKKFRASDDSYVGKIYVGNSSWSEMAPTPDGNYLFIVEYAPSPGGKLVKCDLNQMKVIDSTSLADTPHGIRVSLDGKSLYATTTAGNYLYKINVDSLSKPASWEYVDFTGTGPAPSLQYNAHDIVFSPDGSKYFVSCTGYNGAGDISIKVFDAATDLLITSIPLQAGPYHMDFSVSKNLLFATSSEGIYNGITGRVSIIDLTTNTWLKDLSAGVQPHGLAVDDAAGLVYVANRNISGGAVPHHSSVCGGVNGTLSFIDLNTLETREKEIVMARDPYIITIKN